MLNSSLQKAIGGNEEGARGGSTVDSGDRIGNRNREAFEERGDPSKDVIFSVLRNSRRRQIIRYLMDANRTVTASELAEHIAAIENDIEITQLDSKQRKRVYVALYQTHLPKLDREGIVEYNSDRGRITLSENAAALEPYLDDSYALYEFDLWYFAACLIGGGLVFLLSRLVRKTALIRLCVLLVVSFALSLLVSNYDRHDVASARKLVDAETS